MGLCNKRHFLLTVCTLQLITTVERQVFDFLGFMWLPILFNFFNIIFVIFGFFGAFQYRPKYIIAYSVWNVWWLGWNIFVTCFYLNAGKLDRDSDLLNFGTNSFSWWYVNGPGCKAHYNNTLPEVDRPDVVTDCVLNYEIVEVIHSSIQCLLAVMAIIGGIILSRVFMEEDDSFDFVGGDDFGTAGHTPLHPMYVSYSALSPPKLSTFVGTGGSGAGNTSTTGSNNRDRESYYYPTNTATTTTSDSHRSTSAATLADPTTFVTTPQQPPQQQHHHQKQASKLSALSALSAHSAHSTTHSYRQSPASTPVSSQRRVMHASPLVATTAAAAQVDYDYSNPIDQLPSYRNREDYDTLNPPVAHNSGNRRMYQRGGNSARAGPAPPMPPYSPLMGYRQQQQQQSHLNRTQLSPNGIRNSRNSIRPRMYADHIREQHSQSRLRSFHSDPRLAIEEQSNTVDSTRNNHRNSPHHRQAQQQREDVRRRDGRPISMFINNY
ncbi:hypothetical protein TKK_0009143 [Trichogramma kaykai]|uniref:Sodium/potassium-transporting ATPase subunit beta-1-interacting protein n=1 Tax=Trichogramma kaykai TaxID=54128 RepID=A0ABD2X4X7_9HYME